jgi:hypothetical protein
MYISDDQSSVVRVRKSVWSPKVGRGRERLTIRWSSPWCRKRARREE